MTNQNKLILQLNASALRESSCMLRLYRTVVEGYSAPHATNDVEYGSAFHLFVSTMKQTKGNLGLSLCAAQKRFSVPMIVKPQKKYMDLVHLLKTCQDFWANFGAKDDFITMDDVEGKPMTEVKFSWPYYCDDQVEVNIVGTVDDLCRHRRSGAYAIRDYKTTSSYDAIEYLRGYKLSPQLLTYRLIIRYYAKKYPESVFAEMERNGCLVFIDGVFIHGKDKPIEVIRSECEPIAEDKLVEYEKLLAKKVAELVAVVKDPSLLSRDGLLNGSCHTIYGHCKFFDACSAPDSIARDHVLRKNFVKKPYDPLNF